MSADNCPRCGHMPSDEYGWDCGTFRDLTGSIIYESELCKTRQELASAEQEIASLNKAMESLSSIVEGLWFDRHSNRRLVIVCGLDRWSFASEDPELAEWIEKQQKQQKDDGK